jgi:hypothetical protein
MNNSWIILILLLSSFACSSDLSIKPGVNSLTINEVEQESTSTSITESEVVEPEGDYIKFGESFGMCSGYCFFEITFEKSKCTSVNKAWGDTLNNPTKVALSQLDLSRWNSLNFSINFDLFLKLPEVIGCPDCADGGANWVEVSKSGVSHKIKFEHGNPPKELLNFLALVNG